MINSAANAPREAAAAKAVPVPTPVTQPYWDGTAQRELRLQRCRACSAPVYYARLACPRCGARELDWFTAAGTATLHSFVISHLPAPGFEDDVPYAIAIVELAEGPRMMTSLRGIEPDPSRLRLDMPLAVDFEERGDQIIAVFRPAGDGV
jgi:uncharacterized OB-fold protein